MTLHIYTSGSSRKDDDKWIGSYAFAIYHKGKAIYQLSTAVHPATQNESELIAAIHAIHYARQHYPDDDIQLITGSQYVFGGCKKVTKIKTNQHIWSFFHKVYDSKNTNVDFVPKKDRNAKSKHVSMLAKMKLKTQFAPSLNRV